VEIDKVRALIRRLDDHVDLTQSERDQITEAIGVLRATRRTVVHLGMPITPPSGSDPRDVRAVGR
jgi:hypothetical protein